MTAKPRDPVGRLEAAITRVLGVAFLLAFIVGGVFAIAEPGFLSGEDD